MRQHSARPSKIYIEDYISKKQLKVNAPQLKKGRLPTPSATYILVVNNHTRQFFRLLIEAKCIISRQLPKMPKGYITKLLFDGRHESLLAQNTLGQHMGVVTFRCFEGQDFAEIVFLAVDQQYRDQRVGSQLMDRLKDCLCKKGVKLMLTYADNTALGFFRKQGFESVQETPTCTWNGFIKIYLQGTLMECKIFPGLNYSRFTSILQDTKTNIIARIKAFPIFKYSSITIEEIKKKYSCWNENYRFERVPGLLEALWSSAQEQQFQREGQYSLILQQLFAIQSLRKLNEGIIFRGIKQLPFKYNKQIQLETWAAIQKKIISGRSFKSINQTCKGITNMVQSYEKWLIEGTSEMAMAREFKKKMLIPLGNLQSRQLIIHIDPLFKQRESRGKKSQIGHPKPIRK